MRKAKRTIVTSHKNNKEMKENSTVNHFMPRKASSNIGLAKNNIKT